jgi:RimJ/RimL family protein N-acetyltransferase
MRLSEGDIELRSWEPGDVAMLREAASDAYIAEIERLADPDAWLAEARKGDGLAIAVGGEPAGGIDVSTWHPRRGSLGYFVVERFRGRGVATSAARLLLRWALTDGGYVRVQATVEPFNLASIRVLEKIGMQREGLLRSHVMYRDRVGDAYVYGAVRGDL